MANKPLKSLTFPGLPDTYTVPQVDSTLTITGDAADAKKVGDEITGLKEDLSEIDDRVTELESSPTGYITEEVKQALLQIAQKVAYTDEHGQDYYSDLFAALYPDILYQLTQPKQFNGTSDYIDTGVNLFEEAKDFAIAIDFVYNGASAGYKMLLHNMSEVSPYQGMCLRIDPSTPLLKLFFLTGQNEVLSSFSGERIKLCINFEPNAKRTHYSIKRADGQITTKDISYSVDFSSIEGTLLVGAYRKADGTLGRYFKGTVYNVTVYSRLLTDEEITSYLSGGE